jgi:hypothetical protein
VFGARNVILDETGNARALNEINQAIGGNFFSGLTVIA